MIKAIRNQTIMAPITWLSMSMSIHTAGIKCSLQTHTPSGCTLTLTVTKQSTESLTSLMPYPSCLLMKGRYHDLVPLFHEMTAFLFH